MRPKPAQLSVIAVAALAVFAVAAVLLLSGGNPAQATNAETRTLTPDNSGGGHLLPLATNPTTTPTPTPRFPTPEPCPGEPGNPYDAAAPVVDSGHIALFDVWWNDQREKELTNTSCPPSVTHVPGDPGDEEEERPATPARDVRSPSSIDIAETVIHIPNSAKITLDETDYPKDKFGKLWEADAAESTTGGDGVVWALSACPPEGSPAAPEDGGLCLMFSAALLNDSDWDGKIVYRVAHVHHVDTDTQDPRYVLAYDSVNGMKVLRWSSQDLAFHDMPVPPGGFDRPMWFFTSPGTYEFQVNITGTPNRSFFRTDGLPPVSLEHSVTSDVRTYLIHVGAESDLGVTMTAAPESPGPNDLVTVTLTASNAGPDEAEKTKVDVALPDGLEYVSHEPTTATFAEIPDDDTPADEESENTCACDRPEFEPTHTWSLGAFAKDASQTLTITARVDQGTRGQEFKPKANISATQTVTTTSGNFEVPVPDKVSGNNMAMDTVTVPSIPNVDPMFGIRCIIDDNLAPNSNVCTGIVVMDSDSADTISTLTHSLTGQNSRFFETFTDTNRDIGIKVKDADYPQEPIILNLTVKDDKDEHGNTNGKNDDQIKVVIIVRGGADYFAN